MLKEFTAPSQSSHQSSKEYLRCAELYLEDDYGMLDGIINNGKSEQAKALEDKPSVLEQLRNTETVPRRTDRKADTWELE